MVKDQGEKSRTRVAFFSTIATGDTPRLDTMLGYTLAAVAMEYEIMIFFALDCALVAKKQVFDKLDGKIRDRLVSAAREGVKFAVCSASAQTFGIKETDLIDRVSIEGIASFYVFAENADIVLSWS